MEHPVTPRSQLPNILIVDDTPANLQLLTGMLKERGYRARPVPNGKLALQAAKHDPPDLILLDINMPDMNGYEVCERLKADPQLQKIPVIFISALSDTMDKVKAFQVGGVDYVTKPFQFDEVDARVGVQLQLRRLQLQLEEQNRQLQAGYNELKRLEKMRDDLTHMIVHDMRSPLTAIQGYHDLLTATEVSHLSPKGVGYLERVRGSTAALMEIINSMLDISRMEAGQMPLHLTPCNLAPIIKEVCGRLDSLKGSRHLVVEDPDSPCKVVCDAELITRVIQNLIGNALKFTPGETRISIRAQLTTDLARVTVCDNGPGIPLQFREKIFEKFGQVETQKERRRYSSGLGLTFCKLAVEAHGGRIGVESEMGKGSTFWFELPQKKA